MKFSQSDGNFDYDNYKYISPTDFKFRLFELILNNLEYLWGEAESVAVKYQGTNKNAVPSPFHKLHLGSG